MSRTSHFLDCGCESCVNELVKDIEQLQAENKELKAELAWWGNLVETHNIGKPEANCPSLKAFIQRLQAPNLKIKREWGI